MHVAIIGAGPAGMSCANALLTFGLTPIVIERSNHAGGAQRTNFHPHLWLLGAPEETGMQMTDRLSRHFAELPLQFLRNTEVQAVHRQGKGFVLELKNGAAPHTLEADAVVLATGMRPRATPRLLELAAQSPRVIIGPLSFAIRDEIRASRVLILGGGDNALDHALFLSERGNTVTVCTRGEFSARLPFREACASQATVTLRRECRPTGFHLQDDQVRVHLPEGEQPYDWLLVMYGYEPNTEIVERFDQGIRPRRTRNGHIVVDLWQRSSVAGIYAAGDITDSPQPSVATAIAQGLAAARAVERDLSQAR
ncbi:thioredoxin reductase [Sulfuritortus calidifontis]|uniref:Thioredoxin reductase n=1 Tax=Sulfuritortus calidifontis TaxID=1914471 RepID=A0A4R3JWD6_9PROT|nr:NAD(P)/FAD-dependent oxidoreductase [Sulfuritortus calidifontis]TCS72469.1 thioredoxin reductase [Sulfuritortus calidifontis]